MNEAVDFLKRNPTCTLHIRGHADSKGNSVSNLKLSEKRAEAVKLYLTKKGVNPSKLVTTGFGETQPVGDNATKAGRAQNRRVELK